MKYRCRLYGNSDYDENALRYINRDPLRSFDNILDEENRPFHDELSLEFLWETYQVVFIDDMHYVENIETSMNCGMQYAIHNLSRSMKEGLMLLRNSQEGIYTDLQYVFRDVYLNREYDYFKSFCKFDLLLAYNVDRRWFQATYFQSGYYWLSPFIIENFPFRDDHISVTLLGIGDFLDEEKPIYKLGECFELYHSAEGYFAKAFFDQFEYDWKRDLPEIKDYIDNTYQSYIFFNSCENRYTLYDICRQPEETDGDLKNYPVINHMHRLSRWEAESRRVALIFFIYMEDGSVELYKTVSVKYPKMDEVLTDNYGFGPDVKYAYCLFIDVNETIEKRDDFDRTWFGAYFHKEENYLELFDRDQALIEFSRQIPYVLENLRSPMKSDRELWEIFIKNIYPKYS